MLFMIPVIPSFAQEMSPPKEVTALSWMVGTWSGSGKIAFGGQETAVTVTVTTSFDGQFLKAVSSTKSAGFTMTKTSMTGWDVSNNEYVSYSFTNISPTARIAHGKMDGKKLAMTSDPWEAEGMKAVSRETILKMSDTKYGLLLEMKIGDKWNKGMDIVLTKT